MNMKWSLYLGRISGIQIFIHWTFWILIAWVFIMYYQGGEGIQAALIGVLFIFALFACVVLHELGHALTAQRYKIVTRNITLLPIGGVASMERLPEKPGQELLVAIMGPAVNVAIAAVLFLGLSVGGGMPTPAELEAMSEGEQALSDNFLFNLMVVNVTLVVFNLIPAFPMDGGRVLRALLSYGMERGKATQIAARIGQLLAIGFVFTGFFTNFWLVFIGVFIFLGAGGEAAYEATKSALSSFRVKDVLMKKVTILAPQDTLDKAARTVLDGAEKEFVVADGDKVIGVLTRSNLIKGLSEAGKDAHISGFLNKDFIKLHPDMELKEVFHKMSSGNHSIAPVLEGSTLVGIVDQENISELIMLNKAKHNLQET
jgi:Zn-dependent protease/predicted transcriptional regulator